MTGAIRGANFRNSTSSFACDKQGAINNLSIQTRNSVIYDLQGSAHVGVSERISTLTYILPAIEFFVPTVSMPADMLPF